MYETIVSALIIGHHRGGTRFNPLLSMAKIYKEEYPILAEIIIKKVEKAHFQFNKDEYGINMTYIDTTFNSKDGEFIFTPGISFYSKKIGCHPMEGNIKYTPGSIPDNYSNLSPYEIGLIDHLNAALNTPIDIEVTKTILENIISDSLSITWLYGSDIPPIIYKYTSSLFNEDDWKNISYIIKIAH